MKKNLFLLSALSVAVLSNAQETKTVVVPPSKDTTVVSFTATPAAVASVSVSSLVIVKPTITTPPPVVDSSTAPTGYKEIYRLDFSKASDLDPYGTGQAGNGYIDNGQFHSRPRDGVSGGTRSEVQLSIKMPTEGRIEYDVTYRYIVQDNCHSLQFHPKTDGGSASPGLWHVAGKFVWYNWFGGINAKYATNFTIPNNVKMHMVIEYKLGSSGYLKHWINGQQVLNVTGKQIGDNTATTFKLGFNGGFTTAAVPEALKSDILYDNLVILSKL